MELSHKFITCLIWWHICNPVTLCNPGCDVLWCTVMCLKTGEALQTLCSSLFLYPLLHYWTLYACCISLPFTILAWSHEGVRANMVQRQRTIRRKQCGTEKEGREQRKTRSSWWKANIASFWFSTLWNTGTDLSSEIKLWFQILLS